MAIEQNISTTTEYFASAYSCYIAYPDNLRENCPQTYAYIDNIMRQIDMDYSQMNMEDGYAYSLSY